jgi:hypothetical protein
MNYDDSCNDQASTPITHSKRASSPPPAPHPAHLYGSLHGMRLWKPVPLLLPLLPLLLVAQRSTTAEAHATPSLAASGVMMGQG